MLHIDSEVNGFQAAMARNVGNGRNDVFPLNQTRHLEPMPCMRYNIYHKPLKTLHVIPFFSSRNFVARPYNLPPS